jgi:hypothetical protein
LGTYQHPGVRKVVSALADPLAFRQWTGIQIGDPIVFSPIVVRCSCPECVDIGDVVPDASCSFVEVELELGDRAPEFGGIVEKLDRDDGGVRHLEAFRID